jgi:hypothetical protein
MMQSLESCLETSATRNLPFVVARIMEDKIRDLG